MRRTFALALCLASLPIPASAQQGPTPYGMPVALEQARQIVDSARRAAGERRFTMAFAVVDPSGHLVLFEKMDGTQYGSVVVAQEKARSAALFKRPTKAFSDAVAAGRVAVISLPGALPIEGGDAVVRGVVREVAEETGIDLVGHPIEATGIYIGGYPTHVLVMLSADLRGDVGQAICAFSPVDAHDQVHSIELHTFSNLLDQTWELPLVVRAALQSLLHRRGAEPAWTIPT